MVLFVQDWLWEPDHNYESENTTMRINKSLRASGIKYVRGPFLGITEFALRNGLRVLIKPDHSIASAIVMTAYRVGSRNEGAGEEGGAHLFEHLAFKGSRRFNPSKGNNLDDVFKQIGAQLNAYTSDDQTVYHVQVPAEHVEVALAIDADRMRYLFIRDSDKRTEMPVVRQEMDQGENNPDQAMQKLLQQTAFREHPYHHDTIGSASAVENVSIPTLKAFFDTFYHPNNATVIVMGNVEIEATLAMVQKHFGRLPKSPKPIPPVYVFEPQQEGERRFEIVRTGDLARVAIGYHVPEAGHADTPALHVAGHLLGNSSNRTSRLYKSLVETGMVSSCYCQAPEQHDPSLFVLYATVNEGVAVEAVESVFKAEVDRLLNEPVGDDELKLIKTANKKGTTLALANTFSFAYMIAAAEGYADWTHIVTYDEKYEAVTASDIQRVAAKYLRKSNRTVGLFTPRTEAHEGDFASVETKSEAEVAAPAAVEAQAPKAKRAKKQPDPDAVIKTLARFQGKAPRREPISKRIVKHVLANGLTVNVLKEKPGCGVVSIDTSVAAGNYFDNGKQHTADLVGDLLTRGSARFSKEAIASELHELGITSGLRVNVGPFRAAVSSQVTTEDADRYLSLLGDIIRHPAFKQEELDQAKTEWTAKYKKAENHPASVASTELAASLFPAGHVYHQKSIAEQRADLQSMTVGDLAGFHGARFVPSATTVTIVGDIEPSAAIALIESHFGDWQGAPAEPISVSPVTPQSRRTIVQKMNDKPAVSVYMGAAIELKRTSPDFPAARLALQILGGDTLTARLGKRVREELGLTYGIVARAGNLSHGWAPWMVTMSVATKNINLAIAETNTILDRFVREGVTERELQTQVNGESGSYQIGLSNLQQLTAKVAEFSALGMSLDDIDAYPEQLKAVTVDEVNAAIKKYFDPAKLVTVIAGTV